MAVDDGMTQAEREYFDSKGERTEGVVAENSRLDTDTSRDRISGREHDYSSFSPAERAYFEGRGDTTNGGRGDHAPVLTGRR